MTNNTRATKTLDALRLELLDAASAPDRISSPKDIEATGVPSNMARAIARAARQVSSTADVEEVLEDYRDEIVASFETDLERDPAALAAHVPRGATGRRLPDATSPSNPRPRR